MSQPRSAFRAIFSALSLLLALFLLAERPALAYTDPGTGTLIYQVLVGTALGMSFFLRRFFAWFSRSKKKDR